MFKEILNKIGILEFSLLVYFFSYLYLFLLFFVFVLTYFVNLKFDQQRIIISNSFFHSKGMFLFGHFSLTCAFDKLSMQRILIRVKLIRLKRSTVHISGTLSGASGAISP